MVKYFYKELNFAFKCVLITFEVLLAVHMFIHMIIMIIVYSVHIMPACQEKLTFVAKYFNLLLVFQEMDMQIAIIILYKVLYLFKRVYY